MKKEELARMIDHTILKPEATKEQVELICREALDKHFASVCINPVNVQIVADILKGSDVKVCTVIGFPLGANSTEVKVFEAREAVKNGAEEIDMVINIGKLKDKNYDFVRSDIKAVVDEAKGKALTKVIIETCLLSDQEKIMACKMAKEAGADFVKTSTGFSKAGAKEEDIILMKSIVGDTMGIKASGGIRTYEDAVKMVKAGATRLGCSSSIEIYNKAE